MSRIGKIARLPTAVRDELNERLLEGEPQGELVAWLNGREDVQAVLKARFDGRPINDQNLSAWVQGGYEDWKHQQASLDVASRFVEDTSAVAEVMAKQAGMEGRTEGLLSSLVSDRVAMMAALAIGELLMATRRMEDGAEKRRAILKIIRGLVRLRKSEREQERTQRDAEQAERSGEIHEAWAERAGRRMRTSDSETAGGGRPAVRQVQAKRNVWRPRSIEEMSDAQIRATLVRVGRERPVGGRTASGEAMDRGQSTSTSKSTRTEEGRATGALGEEAKRRLAPNRMPGGEEMEE